MTDTATSTASSAVMGQCMRTFAEYSGIRDRIEAVTELVSMANAAAGALDLDAADTMTLEHKTMVVDRVWTALMHGIMELDR